MTYEENKSSGIALPHMRSSNIKNILHHEDSDIVNREASIPYENTSLDSSKNEIEDLIKAYLQENPRDVKSKILKHSTDLRESLRMLEMTYFNLTSQDDSKLQKAKHLTNIGKYINLTTRVALEVVSLLNSRDKKMQEIVQDLILERYFSCNAATAKLQMEEKLKDYLMIIHKKEELLEEQDMIIDSLNLKLKESSFEAKNLSDNMKLLEHTIRMQETQIDHFRNCQGDIHKNHDEIGIDSRSEKSVLAGFKQSQMDIKKKDSNSDKARIRKLLKSKDEEILLLKKTLESSKIEKKLSMQENRELKKRMETILKALELTK